MHLIIGTAAGAFLKNGADPIRATGLEGRNLRHVSRAGEAVLAGADTGVFRSTDGGRTFVPSGLDGRFVWDVGSVGGALYAVTQPAELHISRDLGVTWTEIETLRRFPDAERWCVPIT